MRVLSSKNLIAIATLSTAAVVASMGYYSFPLSDVPIGTDSAVFTYIGELILRGGMPYVDVFDHKGPLIYLINALAALAPDTCLLWLIETLFLCASLLLSYAIGVRMGASPIVAAFVPMVLVTYVVFKAEGGNMTELYCLPFVLTVIFVSIRVFSGARLRRFDAMAMGASGAMVFLLRFTELLALAPFCLYMLYETRRAGGTRHAASCFGWYLTGLIGALLPFAVWLAARGALLPFFEHYILFNSSYSGNTTWQMRAGSLAYFAFDPALAISLVAGVLAWALCWVGRDERCARHNAILAVNFVALAAVFAIAGLSGRNYGHYSLMFVACYFIPAYELAIQARRAMKSNVALAAASALLCLALVYFPCAWKAAGESAYRMTLIEPRGQVARALSEIADDDKVLVVGNECWIYLETGFTGSAPYAYRSDDMAQLYNTWLEGVLASPDAPSAIVVADYASVGLAELRGYRLVEALQGFSIYARE